MMRMVTAQDKHKSRLETDAPLCPKCKTRMKVRTLLPGREFGAKKGPCERCNARGRSGPNYPVMGRVGRLWIATNSASFLRA
jgi:hypothetical protein